MVFMEIDFDINKENMEKFDDWLDTKPKFIKKVRYLTGEESEKLLV